MNRTPLNETWLFRGGTWTQVAQSSPITAALDPEIVFDDRRGRALVTSVDATYVSNTVWSFDGIDWTELPNSAFVPGNQAPQRDLAYDSARDRVVMFGTRYPTNEPITWELVDPTPYANVESFGVGCAGSAGVPELEARDGAVPRLGFPIALDVSPVPPVPVVHPLLVLGLSDATTSYGLPLPIDLSPLGMAGCALLVSDDWFGPMVAQSGTASWTSTLPGDPSLVGAQVFAQSLVVDPGANAFGATTSNALKLTLGT